MEQTAQPTADSRQQTADSKQQAANSRQRIAAVDQVMLILVWLSAVCCLLYANS